MAAIRIKNYMNKASLNKRVQTQLGTSCPTTMEATDPGTTTNGLAAFLAAHFLAP